MSEAEAYYVVFNGRVPGLYASWEACRAQIDGFVDPCFERFASPEEAARAWDRGPSRGAVPRPAARPGQFAAGAIAVDAACAGNPGPTQYRGVDLATGDEVFAFGPFHGTNNLGEFLAVVHGLGWQRARASVAPVYSDSRVALDWVRARRVGLGLRRDRACATAWALAERALAWLRANSDHGVVIKWPTAQWGEIPADYGRKRSRGRAASHT